MWLDLDNIQDLLCISDKGLLVFYDVRNDEFNPIDFDPVFDEMPEIMIKELNRIESDRSAVRVLDVNKLDTFTNVCPAEEE